MKRFFVLGPSHHVYIDGCALSKCDKYATPLGNISIDKQVYGELRQSGAPWTNLTVKQDEEEHSLELHLPFIAKVMENYADQYTIVPIVVGHLSAKHEEIYGELLSSYFHDPGNVFIISSDFCHWGRRFSFTAYDRQQGEIFESIENLDRQGMNLIEQLDPRAFHDYLKATGNTICGRNPICLLLRALKSLKARSNGLRMEMKFLKYAQSNTAHSLHDSSVSYAAAALVLSD